MKELNLIKLRVRFEEAQKLKHQVEKMYRDATALTFPNNDAYYDIDNDSINMKNGSLAIYNDLSVEVAETLANQMELSLFRAGDNWAMFSVPDALENEEAAMEARDVTKEVFNFIHESNFQLNISNCTADLIIGTTCLKLMVVAEGKEKKLIYKHLSLGRVYALENGLGQVDTVFYKLKGFTVPKLEDMIGSEIQDKEWVKHKVYENAQDTIFDIFECAFPNDQGGFTYCIVDEGFTTVLYQKELVYNPFIVARFKKRNDISVWGIGKAVERLSLIKTLQHFSKIKLRVTDQDSRPAYLVTTANGKPLDLDLNPGHYNFAPVNSQIMPLFSNIDHQKLDNYIFQLEDKLKQAFLIDGILETQMQNTYKTATEIQESNAKFLDKFATYASTISYELPKEILNRTYDLLKQEKMIKGFSSKKNRKKVLYLNSVTKNEKQKQVDILLQIAQTAIGIVGQENLVAGMKNDKILPWLVDKFSGDYDIFVSQEEAEANREEITEAKMAQEGAMNAPTGMAPGGGMVESQGIADSVGY